MNVVLNWMTPCYFHIFYILDCIDWAGAIIQEFWMYCAFVKLQGWWHARWRFVTKRNEFMPIALLLDITAIQNRCHLSVFRQSGWLPLSNSNQKDAAAGMQLKSKNWGAQHAIIRSATPWSFCWNVGHVSWYLGTKSNTQRQLWVPHKGKGLSRYMQRQGQFGAV